MEAMTMHKIQEELKALNNWEYKDNFIVTTIQCADFKEAFSLMTRIAFVAEALAHHPNWENVYNTITIKLQTHDAGGVTQKDFNFAKQVEDLRS